MSWSPFVTSSNARFGVKSAVFDDKTSFFTSVSVDTLESFSIELWYYKTNDGPCTIFSAQSPTFGLFLNRHGNYILRLLGQHSDNDICDVSLLSETTVKNDTWNHVCVQYSKKLNIYTLYSNGNQLIRTRSNHLGPGIFDMIQFGSSNERWRFHGNMDTIRISSCVRYRSLMYDLQTHPLIADSYTLALNDFEDTVFVMDETSVYTEKNWKNTSLNKTQDEYMSGSRSIYVDSHTQFLPTLTTPGINMNSMNWTIEFFFKTDAMNMKKIDILKRGELGLVLSGRSMRLMDDDKELITIKKEIILGEWNHVCLCHEKDNHRLIMGINGMTKRTRTFPKIGNGTDVIIGSRELVNEIIYYDCFRLSVGSLYGTKKYNIPSSIEDNWSSLDSQTLMYSSFEIPPFVATNVTSFSVLLSWIPKNGSKKYTLHKDGKETRYNTRETEIIVYDLKEDREYEFCLYSDGIKLYKSLSIKTKKSSKDNNFDILSSIATRGNYDVSKLPRDVIDKIDMDDVFMDRDRIIVPLRTKNMVAKYTSVSTTVSPEESTKALLVPFKKTGDTINIKSKDGTLTDVSFIEGKVKVNGKELKKDTYVIVGGKKMKVVDL